MALEVQHERCCGLDVHQAVIVACLIVQVTATKAKKEIRKFSTVQAGLKELVAWLVESGCTLVAMESTGVYWMPLYEMLEGKTGVLVTNAEHMRTLPGRKTDVHDSEWIADLARHGLLRPSFVPAKVIRSLRDLTRMRRDLVQTATTMQNRLTKLLEQAGVKLATFLSEVFGKSGRLMIQALIAGKLNASDMAELAKGTLRKKKSDIALALDVELTEERRHLLEHRYQHVLYIEKQVAEMDALIAAACEPYGEQMKLLATIPGLGDILVPAIIGEVGVDLSSFRHQKQFASWCGVCPGNNISAGKSKHGRIRHGNIYVRVLLTEAAWAAVRTPGYLQEKFYKLKVRRGPKKAIIAIAHKIAIAIFQVLRTGKPYADLGACYLDGLRKTARPARLIRKLESLGYKVTAPASPVTAVAPATAGKPAGPAEKHAKPRVRAYVLRPFQAAQPVDPVVNQKSAKKPAKAPRANKTARTRA